MSRRRKTVAVSCSAWLERDGAHACAALRHALEDAVYEVFQVLARGARLSRRKWTRRPVLVLAPNIDRVVPMRDRLRHCPYCGTRVRPQPVTTPHGPAPAVPDTLPDEVR